MRKAPVLFSADEVQYDQDLGLTVARGHVELDQADNILLADAVTYNQRSDTVTASGHVALLQPTGDIMFADFAELHDEMRDGFIKDIRILLSDRSRLAGNTARRVAGVRTTIRRAVYSPCELCQDDPTRPPVWQIKAEEVVHDKELQLVEYHDAIMEIDGVPVFYAPYFSHPDPSVKRASGFLPPTMGYGTTLGAHVTLPYYWDIAPDKDATFRPLITTSAGVVLGGEYRERFSNGVMVNDGSIEAGGGSESANAGNVGPATGQVRWHLFGNGDWDLNDQSRTGYQVQRESDQTYMLRYHFPTPWNYLTTHLYGENFGPNSYGNISGLTYQSLSPLYGNSLEPIAAPDALYTWTGEPDALGGRWNLTGSALNLIHHHRARGAPRLDRGRVGAAVRRPLRRPPDLAREPQDGRIFRRSRRIDAEHAAGDDRIRRDAATAVQCQHHQHVGGTRIPADSAQVALSLGARGRRRQRAHRADRRRDRGALRPQSGAHPERGFARLRVRRERPLRPQPPARLRPGR